MFRADEFAIAAACLGLGAMGGRMSIDRVFELTGAFKGTTRFGINLTVRKILFGQPIYGLGVMKGDKAPRIYFGFMVGTSALIGRETITKALKGWPSGVSAIVGRETIAKLLEGTPAGLGVPMALPTVDRMRGTVSAGTSVMSADGRLMVTKALEGTLYGLSTVFGEQPIIVKNFSGTAQGLAIVTVFETITKAFAGSTAGVGGMSADGTQIVVKAFAGASTGLATVSGQETFTKAFSGSPAGFTSMSVAIVVDRMRGVMNGVTALTATPIVVKPLASSVVAGVGATTGGITVQQMLSGATIAGASSVSGTITFGNFQTTEDGIRRTREGGDSRLVENDYLTD